jgi:hypothetical protein
MQFFYATGRSFNMKIEVHISAEVDPQEFKTIIKMAKKLGAAELLQQVTSAATPAPAAASELPTGTFVGGEEVPIEESASAPTPASKRGRKPKATLGFR